MHECKLFWSAWSCLLFAQLVPSIAHAQSAASVAAQIQSAIERGNLPGWWNPQLPEEIQRDVHSKGQRLAEQLKLNDEQKTQKAAALISEHYGRVWAWHQQVDAKLNAAWAAWDAARDNTNGKQKDELKALLIWTEQLEPIYAEFTPQIQGLSRTLTEEIGEEKNILLQDIITRSPGAKRTYDAYLAMVPELKDEEKAILWNRLVRAREASLAVWSDKQIVKMFKLQKVRNELSIDHFGYNYQKRYKEWVAQGAR